MTETQREALVERNLTANPMWNRASLEKMRASVKARAHCPVQRVTGGAPPTVPQANLAEAIRLKLGIAPQIEYVVLTSTIKGDFERESQKRINTNYKLDIALPSIKLAIEVDGTKHRAFAQQALDQKKESVLSALGWVTLRFKNEEVIKNPERCVSTILKTASILMAAQK